MSGVAVLGITSCTKPAYQQPDAPIQEVPFTQVHINDGFWLPRIETNRTVCFNTGQPKTIINMYLGKRNFLNRSIRLLIGRFCAGSDSQHSDTTHQYQKLVLHII